MEIPTFVSETQLRKMFNDGQYQQKAESGELMSIVTKDGHPSPRPSFEPFCTRSQIVVYRDVFGEKIATIHRYLRPDNTLGASGKPDPKMLRHDGVVYAVRTT